MNNMKIGYKNTEVGVIPSDWEVKTISQISNPVRGGSPRPAGDPKYFNGDFIPWLTVAALTNIPESQLYVIETGSKLTQEGAVHSRTLQIGTVIIANSGFSLGISKILNIKCCANDGIAALLDFDSNLDKEYVTYYLNTLTEKLRKVIAIGNDQPNLNKERIGKISIPVPTLSEQTAIATALSDADALISSLEKLIAKKRNIKQGAMQELLAPREGWEVRRLGSLTKVFTKQTGFDYTAYIKPSLVQNRTEDTIPFIQNKDFNNRWINFETDYFIPRNIAIQFPKILLNEKSLLISISGSVGNVGLFDSQELAFIGGAVAILKFKDYDLIDWVLVYLKSVEGQKKLLDNVKAGSHQNLILDDIRKIEIIFPTKEEQTRIATILSDMDAEISALEGKLDKYRKVKMGMMQELLTGKIRLV